MSLRTRVVVSLLTLSSLAFLVACGGNSFNHGTPPPSGGFNNSNLNGTYVFSVTGSDASGFFQTIAGTFTANGSGAITGGTVELNNAGTGFVAPQSVTGGSYSVGADGRGGFRTGGGLILQTSSGTLMFDFVLSSSSHGLITQFDGNGTGSGTLDLQSAVSQANINGNSYAFNLSGVYSVSSTTGAQTALATVGSFTVDASGNLTGFEDFNENGTSSVCGAVLTACTITSGSINLATVPGTATFVTNNPTITTLNFDVYPVDATHLKFIETDAVPFAAGDAFTQSSSIPAGSYVFTVAGFDSLAQGPFTSAGLIVTDGAGNVTNASVQDINDFGNVPNPTSFTGTYSAVSGGSSLLTLTGFVNGNNGAGCNPCQFAAYPSSGGLQILEIDNGGSTAGVAYTQSATALASNEGYGMNLTGFAFTSTGNFEEDDIAEFVNNNGSFTGLIDVNDQSTITAAQHFSSTYAADSTVPGRGVITPGTNGFNLVSYVVDSSTAVFVEIDNNPLQVGIGSFALQNASASSNAAAAHLKVLRLKPAIKAMKRR